VARLGGMEDPGLRQGAAGKGPGGRMAASATVAYYRVSTARQRASGLALEAQRATVAGFLTRRRGELIAEFVEAESCARNDWPRLAEALRLCRIHRATVVRLDRLSRNATMIAELMDSGVDFVAADMPLANRFTIHIVAAVAEYALKLISDRIRVALAVAKRSCAGAMSSYPPSSSKIHGDR
jgi:DNA invertase Pin-like site-specific DNA recombinase